jgi:hypothetical protein
MYRPLVSPFTTRTQTASIVDEASSGEVADELARV